MHYIVFDLEATCWNERTKNKNEIIEIGAVMFNDKLELMGSFEQFVRPKLHPELSAFCTELTSIRQEDVDSAPFFPEAVARFREWFSPNGEPFVLCSWGLYDRNQLRSDCKVHDLEADWVDHHISLKHQHGEFNRFRKGMGMAGALAEDGFSLEGTHHRGIDDARNISKIFLKHFEKWTFPASA